MPDIVGFVNSAPAVWKDNGKSCGGYLRAGAETAFAGYLADIVSHLTAAPTSAGPSPTTARYAAPKAPSAWT